MAGMNTVLLVLVTFPDAEKARQIGTLMVESQLAACVNLVSGVESIYRWQGKVETSQEVLAIFKTTQGTWAAFEAKMRELHPYDVPEIVALRPEQLSDMYGQWVVNSVAR
ncbi:MAG: CutA1 divalent ion tolerance protein [Verrucomicrobiaceae bacterium]|nr:CutA1 divalent ion tolerance protein [Verrucomicrobiaceae bacterium]